MIEKAFHCLQNLHIKNTFLQILGVYLMVFGVKKGFQARYAEYYMMFINEDFTNPNLPSDLNAYDVLANPILYSFFFYLCLVCFLGIIHWLLRIKRVNFISILLISISLFPIGGYTGEYISSALNSFCYLFSSNMKTAFYFGGVILIVIGVFLLFLELRKYFIKLENYSFINTSNRF